MSAKTSIIARLASLFAISVEFIQKNKRSSTMVDALLNALQLFKEGKLDRVILKRDPEEEPNTKPLELPETKFEGFEWGNFTKWVRERIEAFESDPAGHANDPSCFAAATIAVGQDRPGWPSHQWHCNEIFYLVVRFGFPRHQQREAAWWAVSNGLNDYWEWRNHDGFDVYALLEELGVELDERDKPTKDYLGYSSMTDDVARQLIQMFDLPTTACGIKDKLSSGEEEERERFNRSYPYMSVL